MYHTYVQAVDDGELVGSMYGLRKRHPDPDHDSRAADSMPADMSRWHNMLTCCVGRVAVSIANITAGA